MRVVALLARPPGVEVLKALFARPKVDIIRCYTPRYLPKADGGIESPEGTEMVLLCREMDTHCELTQPQFPLDIPPCDLLLSCNWRQMITPEQTSQARFAINIHRGDLPRYKGARPVRQAILAGDTQTCITAHEMTQELDAGAPIAKVYSNRKTMGMQGLIDPGSESALDQAEAIERAALMPLYAPLTGLLISHVNRRLGLTDDGWDGLGPGGS